MGDESGDSSVLLVGRVLVAALFLWSGIGKVTGYDETVQFMAHNGLLSMLLPAAVVIEVGGATLLIVGYKMRVATLVLAGFCVLTALLFHANFPERAQMLHFLKNFAIAGGLLALHVAGPGRLSLDRLAESDD